MYTDEFWVTEGRSCFCMHISAKQSQAFSPTYIFRVFSSHPACFWKNWWCSKNAFWSQPCKFQRLSCLVTLNALSVQHGFATRFRSQPSDCACKSIWHPWFKFVKALSVPRNIKGTSHIFRLQAQTRARTTLKGSMNYLHPHWWFPVIGDHQQSSV